MSRTLTWLYVHEFGFSTRKLCLRPYRFSYLFFTTTVPPHHKKTILEWSKVGDSNGNVPLFLFVVSFNHKVRITKENHSVCPLVGMGTLPTPLSPSPQNRGGGGTLACGWGVGGVPIPTTVEKAQHTAYSVVLIIRDYLVVFLRKLW